MTRYCCVTLVCCGLLLAALSAEAGVVSLGASKDNTLYEVAPALGNGNGGPPSNGAGVSFFSGRTSNPKGPGIRRGVVAFDVAAAVPAGSTITSAQLVLSMVQTISGPETVDLHRLTADWGEGTTNATSGGGGGGAPATTGDATWLHTFYPGSFWTVAGGDFAATVSASQSVGAIGPYTWGSTAQMVADVQDWLDNPAGNFGWILIGNEAALGSAKRFETRESALVRGGGASPPQLILDFTGGVPTAPPAIPALSAWGLTFLTLALFGAAAWLLRRNPGAQR
jgi:hypothetical protein